LSYVSDKQKAGTPFEGQLVSDVSPEELDEAFHDFEPSAKSLLKVSPSDGSLMPFSIDEKFSVVLRKYDEMGTSCSK